MTARLNRRRYREVVAMLKEVVADKKATRLQRLRAGETLLAVYDRHDRTEQQKEARRLVDAKGGSAATCETPDMAPESAEEAARAFLDKLKTRTVAERTRG